MQFIMKSSLAFCNRLDAGVRAYHRDYYSIGVLGVKVPTALPLAGAQPGS